MPDGRRHQRPLPWPWILIAANGAFAAIAALQWAATKPLPAARFEYGIEREFSGAFQWLPYPSIAQGNDRRFTLLVAPGKHGAAHLAEGLRDGQTISVRGSLIERDGRDMIEVASLARTQSTAAFSSAAPKLLGPAELRGEIVDSKCFLGVMNPGSGKVHRGCAARCISGGVPPVLFVRGTPPRYVLLAGLRGEALRGADVAPFAAETVTVAGDLFELDGNWLQLRADVPGAVRRRGRRE